MSGSEVQSDATKRARRRFPVVALMAWAIFAFAVPRLSQSLNAVDLFAFPLGFFMLAQGSLLALLAIALLSARRRDRVEAALLPPKD